MELPALTTSTGDITLQTANGGGTINAPLLATFTGGTVNDGGGTVNLPALATAPGASFYVSNDSTLSLPQLTTYTQPTNILTATLQASGAGSVSRCPTWPQSPIPAP